jgi:hypothetical protein
MAQNHLHSLAALHSVFANAIENSIGLSSLAAFCRISPVLSGNIANGRGRNPDYSNTPNTPVSLRSDLGYIADSPSTKKVTLIYAICRTRQNVTKNLISDGRPSICPEHVRCVAEEIDVCERRLFFKLSQDLGGRR